MGSRSARDERLAQVGGRRLGAQLDQQVADRRSCQAGVENREQEDERRQAHDDEHGALDGQKRIQRDLQSQAEQQDGAHHERQREEADEHPDRCRQRSAGRAAAGDHDDESDQEEHRDCDQLDPEEVRGELGSVDHRERVARIEAAEHQADDVERRNRVGGADQQRARHGCAEPRSGRRGRRA